MILAILVIIFVLGILILAHEFGHFVAAKLSGVRVEEFGLGMFVKLWSVKKGETEYSVNAIPIGGFVKITGEDEAVKGDKRSFSEKSPWQQIFILGSGVFMNLVVALLIFIITFWVGMPIWGTRVKITKVGADTPAAQAGLAASDVILKIGDQKVESSQDLVSYTQAHLDQNAILTIQRDGNNIESSIFLRANPPSGQGAMGIESQTEVYVAAYSQNSFLEGIKKGCQTTFETAGTIAQGMYFLFRDLIIHQKAPADVAGPVGIGQIVFELLKFGIRPVLQFAGIISLNLLFINLLPIPAIDGGRILFVAIEAITRRKIPSKVNRWANATGMVLVLILMVVITFHDIVRLFD